MRWKTPSLVVLAVGLGLFLARFRLRDDFESPENFPVLEAEEIGTEAASISKEPELATFGSGCFWCTEAMFQKLKGVKSVASGYSGGSVKDPTYEQICNGRTGHAEVVQVTFDPKIISYVQLLEVFWRTHDPTTEDRQGNDRGSQYRSAIFHHSERQRELAELYKKKIDNAHVFKSPLVTEITAYTEFFKAEDEHQNFYAQNSRQPYCRSVIRPKLDKLQKVFGEKLKTDGE
ncbi:MAG: peptide-methionine (S)-S-oxide reductase [Gemmataceae bacterium]|nr:peptide-methionine (S)-S-oxide reductase [Gemmataceae bacterium]